MLTMAPNNNNGKVFFQKTETEYNLKSIRFLLMTITTMFIIISLLMIVLGVSVYSRYHDFTFLYESVRSGKLFTPSILVVFLGVIMIVVTSFGFFGSLRESTCMVNTYALLLFVVFIFELVVVCVSFTTDPHKLMTYIDVPVQYYSTDPEIQAEMDMLQSTLRCCGSDSYLDYVGQEFTSNHTTAVASTEINGDAVALILPTSCCSLHSNNICSRFYGTGCQVALANVVVQNTSVLGVLGVSVMFIQVLGITFSLLLARCIRKMKSERALMRWKITENIINARHDDVTKEDPSKVFIEQSYSSQA